jgi:hypothetical protein
MTANLRRKWPAEALRVAVYAGIDPVTKRRHYLGEVIPAGLSAAKEADRAMRRMASQVDERRNPRTSATVDQTLDRYFDVVDLERNRRPHKCCRPHVCRPCPRQRFGRSTSS